MRFAITLLLILFASELMATSITSKIYDIDLGSDDEEAHLYLMTGRILTLKDKSSSQLKELLRTKDAGDWITFETNSKREVLSFWKSTKSYSLNNKSHFFKPLISQEYSPSILSSLNEARQIFYEMRTDAKEESQCFNRAHVWAYEWRINKNLFTSKVWLFFTRKFIRKYKFEWWFHVAPMVHVNMDGVIRERIMDMKYSRGPLALKNWSDIFIRDKSDCPVVEKYSDQADHPESGSCFVMKSSMYDYQPVDLEESEFKGEQKMRWLSSEVKEAYLEAFNITI